MVELHGHLMRKVSSAKSLDSFSDVISFGVAPAFIMYSVAFQELNPAPAWIITALFPICGALAFGKIQCGFWHAGLFHRASDSSCRRRTCNIGVIPSMTLPYQCLMAEYIGAFVLNGQHDQVSEFQEGRHSEKCDLGRSDYRCYCGCAGDLVPASSIQNYFRTFGDLCVIRPKKKR